MRDETQGDPMLSDEGRAAALAEERRRAEAEVIRQRQLAATARATVEEIAQAERAAAPGPDAPLVADARARVRSLLDGGAAVVRIRDQAAAQGDRATLDALRHELAYADLGNANLGDALGSSLGAEEGTDPRAAVVASIDEAERLLLTGDERVAADALSLVNRKWASVEVSLANAAKLEDGGGLSGALSAKMAGG